VRGAHGGWELEKGWRTQVPGLDEAELRALLMAQPRAIGHPRLMAAAESALNKLMASLPGPLKLQAAAMRERLHVDPTGWSGTGEDLSMLGVVQQAVAEERKLVFDYTRADGQKGPRTVEPLGLVAKGLSWYLVARGTNGMRTYRVSRMEGVTPLASKFERPAQFDLAAYWKESTAQFEGQRGQFAAMLRVAPGSERALSMWCTRCAALGGVGDGAGLEGWMTVRAEFESEWHARFVVLGMGARVRVIEPAELARSVAAEIEAVAKELLNQATAGARM
jgi:predicted DNA-binding transcriptional regulator YafY